MVGASGVSALKLNSIPVDCQLGEWGSWSSPCRCDERIRKRKKNVLFSELYGGQPCPDEEEMQRCEPIGCKGVVTFKMR